MTKRRRDRFERSKIIIPILLAGWIPSVLTLIVSYTILRDTLESRILRDRHTLVQLLGHVVGTRSQPEQLHDRIITDAAGGRPGFSVRRIPRRPPTMGQLCLLFASEVDGMFSAAADGALIASIPTTPELVGKDFGAELLA